MHFVCKKCFFFFVFALFVAFIMPFSNTAIASADGLVFGFGSNFLVGSSGFQNYGSVNLHESQGILYSNRFNDNKGYGAHGFISFKDFSGFDLGVELGYSYNDFLPADPNVPSQYFTTDISRLTIRIDKSLNFQSCFDFIAGSYIGFASVRYSGEFLLNDLNYNYSFEKERFNNLILGARSGVAYRIGDNSSIGLNYLLSILPKIRKQHLLAVDESGQLEQMSISGIELITHSVELSFQSCIG